MTSGARKILPAVLATLLIAAPAVADTVPKVKGAVTTANPNRKEQTCLSTRPITFATSGTFFDNPRRSLIGHPYTTSAEAVPYQA